jgi:Zn finger protein HypA/HybF involved in hydrogenase expression
MRQVVEATKVDGVIVPKHEIEIVCANCEDPVSAQEEVSGTCTNCGQPWNVKQSISIHATTVPAAGGKTLGG